MSREKILKQFGSNLKKYREQCGISQEKLAEFIGVHRTYIGLVERGKKSISVIYIIKIKEILNIEYTDLFRGL